MGKTTLQADDLNVAPWRDLQCLFAYLNDLEGFNVDWMRIFLLTQVPCRLMVYVLFWRIWAQFLIDRKGIIQDLQYWTVGEVNALPPTLFWAWLCISSLLMFWGKESTKFLDSTSKNKGEKSIWSKKPFESCFPVSVLEVEIPEVHAVGDSSDVPPSVPMDPREPWVQRCQLLTWKLILPPDLLGWPWQGETPLVTVALC